MEIFHYCDTSPPRTEPSLTFGLRSWNSLGAIRGSNTYWSDAQCSAMIFGPFKSKNARLILRCCRPIRGCRIRRNMTRRSSPSWRDIWQHLQGGFR